MKGFFLATVENGCCEEVSTRKHYKFSKSRFNSENELRGGALPLRNGQLSLFFLGLEATSAV
jgi:hypothetical protein